MLELYNMCGLEMIRGLKNDSIDLILTDPPYNISRENNFSTMGRQGIDFGEWDKDFEVLEWLKPTFSKVKKGGSVIIFNSWKNIGEIAKYAETLGYETKDMLRWKKSNPMPRNRDRRYITDYEVAVWLVKPKGKWTFNRQDENYDRPELYYAAPNGKKRIHPTQKPVELLEELLRRHTNEGDVVVDMFSGSGSCLEACFNMNRGFIGSEIDSNMYRKVIEKFSELNIKKEKDD